ncbi:MAG: hypothetical protein DI580_02850 [Cutibacterium acnes]|nr:MAG: hypothetical protein DI580_02850 [Cutibacterium acnes]
MRRWAPRIAASAAWRCGRVVVNMASTVLPKALVTHHAGGRIGWSSRGMSVFSPRERRTLRHRRHPVIGWFYDDQRPFAPLRSPHQVAHRRRMG